MNPLKANEGETVRSSTIASDQLFGSVFRVRKCLKFSTRLENNESFVTVEDPVRSKHFRIGLTEYRFIAKVNGVRTNAEILELLEAEQADAQANSAASDIQADEVLQIANWLLAMNLVTVSQTDNANRLNAMAQQIDQAKIVGWLNPISMKVSLFNPNRFLQTIQPVTQWMFSSWVALLWAITGVYSLSCLASNWQRVFSSSAGVFSSDSWIWLLITWFVLKVIHETAHGIACRRYGGEVPEFGVLFLLFAPMAFVNVTSMWRFRNRWQRMVVSGAGMYLELWIAFFAIIVWSQTDGVVASTAFSIMVMSSVTTILFNANPLMRFDGYFLLSDFLAIPNLYGKGSQWFSESVRKTFFGVPRQTHFRANERIAVSVYGSLAFLWKISISLGLIIAASVLLQGAGLVLSGIGVVLWFGLPIAKQVAMLTSKKSQFSIDRVRTGISLSCLAGLVAAGFYVFQAPATKSAPAIVQFCNESIIRSDASGFVTAIHVEEGQTVAKGDLLLELGNPELANELVEITRLQNEARVQSRIYQQQGNQAMMQAENKRALRLAAQIVEKQTAAAGLKVLANRDGVVVERVLQNRLGSFVERGDHLLTVAKLIDKEVVVSVDQSEYDAAVWSTGKQLRLMFPGRPVVKATLVSINPRASTTPTFPSLTATMGGSLPVRSASSSSSADSESSVELLSPRFDVTVAVPEGFGKEILAGQRGQAYFESTEQSLASYLYLAACHWLQSKVDMATLGN